MEETVRGDGNFELTVNELIRHQSRMIECVDAMTIEVTREIREGLDTDQDVQRMRGQDLYHVRERGHIWTVFCILTTESLNISQVLSSFVGKR